MTVREVPSEDWDTFVMHAPDASLYHLTGWTELAREVFGHRTLFVESRERDGSLVGVLPMVQQRSWLLGNFATSVAFFNYGGAIAANPDVAQQMMVRASETADKLGCRFLEFRDTQARPGNWAARKDKIVLRLELAPTFEELSKRLGSKLRSQVKRAEREGVQCRTGTLALLDDFYAVFAENMRDLGTPVYPKRFFDAILRRYERHCQFVVIDWRGRPVAAAFLVFWRGRAEVPWASCLAEGKPLGMNMKLYWELLSLSIGRGCKVFDFGRSTVGAGTDRFKRQWGAQPVPLYWYRWERGGSGAETAAGEERGRVMRLATAMWQATAAQYCEQVGTNRQRSTAVVSALKRIAKRIAVHAAARVAPITWKWRRPGSLVVLMYHRVLPKDSPARKTEEPGMYVSPETFDLHLTELKRRFELVHLDEWLRRARGGLPLPKLACAITFDDGWRDNYEFALPVLVQHNAPATIFLVSSYVGTAQRFWPNRLMGLLDKAFAEPGSVDFPEPLRGIIEPTLIQARRHGVLRADDIDRAIQGAKRLDEEQIRSLVEEAEKTCDDPTGAAEILSRSDVVQMAASGLVRFGSHTMTHLRLGGRIPSRISSER